jgi:hypothetical protein
LFEIVFKYYLKLTQIKNNIHKTIRLKLPNKDKEKEEICNKMSKKIIIRENEYYDSILLMNLSSEIQKTQGVKQVVLLMGTDMNKTVLKELKLNNQETNLATPND